MKLLKVAAAVLNQTPLDWSRNRDNIIDAIDQARKQGVTVLCLPELCISGYGCEDAFHSSGMVQRCLDILQQIIGDSKGMIISIGLPLMYQNGLFNTVCLAVDGQIGGFVAKQFLAGDGIHYEPRWFKAWPSGAVVQIEIENLFYPLGDIIFDCGGIKIGFEICEDAWVARRPGGRLSMDGADLILNPSASHFAFGKHEVRKRLVLEGSRAFGVTYLYSNLLGNEAGRAIYDGGAMVASGGKLIAQGDRFSFRNFQITTAVIDIDTTRTQQTRSASFTPRIGDHGEEWVKCNFELPDIHPVTSKINQAKWEQSSHIKEEEFTRAVALALFDYLRKSRSNGFVVSLSGGADSSAVCCIIAMLVEMGVQELGIAEFVLKLNYIPALQMAKSTNELIRKLLTSIYQSTRNSTEVTQRAAKTLADAIGADFIEFDVDTMVNQYTSMVSGAIGRDLNWRTDDIALQNIQARVRGPGVWMIANLRNALLLATSNRSEAAVGYATMDGDTCGSISPIAGIDKAFIRHWLRWIETAGPTGFHNIPALKFVNEQSPTAELRPQSDSQTDEADLMPYDLLDYIERLAIRDKLTPVEIYRNVRPNFIQYSVDQLIVWIERFFKLWCRNQWKRERYAPSFHLDDENLDPKTWCRFPILSGGFTEELNDLRKLFATKS